MSLTHAELCERARRWLGATARCPIVLVEFVTLLPEIPDAIGFRSSGAESVLIECKASRSDFLRDRSKRHRQPGAEGLGTFRFYMCEPGVINVQDLPPKWGLLWVRGRQIEQLTGDTCMWLPEGNPWRWPSGERERTLMFSALTRLKMALGAKDFQVQVQRTFPRPSMGPAPVKAVAPWPT